MDDKVESSSPENEEQGIHSLKNMEANGKMEALQPESLNNGAINEDDVDWVNISPSGKVARKKDKEVDNTNYNSRPICEDSHGSELNANEEIGVCPQNMDYLNRLGSIGLENCSMDPTMLMAPNTYSKKETTSYSKAQSSQSSLELGKIKYGVKTKGFTATTSLAMQANKALRSRGSRDCLKKKYKRHKKRKIGTVKGWEKGQLSGILIGDSNIQNMNKVIMQKDDLAAIEI
ncbi:hypothetical protein Ancab_025205 [Ancistrocladus abbreviatus]